MSDSCAPLILEINTKFKNRVVYAPFKNRVFNASMPPLQGVAKGCYRFPVYFFY